MPSVSSLQSHLGWDRRSIWSRVEPQPEMEFQLGSDSVHCQSERRRRQDDHRHQPGRRAGIGRLAHPVGRPRPAVQCHQRPGPEAGRPASAGIADPAARIAAGNRCAGAGGPARQPQLPGCGTAGRRREPDRHAAAAPGQRAECLRFRADRLPAVAGATYPHGSGQFHRSGHAHPVRILRHGRPGPNDRSHPPGDAAAAAAACSSAASC